MDEAAAFLNEVSPPLCCRMFSLHVLGAKRALRGDGDVRVRRAFGEVRSFAITKVSTHTVGLSSMERIQFPGYAGDENYQVNL